MATVMLQLPRELTVDVKDFGLVSLQTEQWTSEFVRDVVKAFVKAKLEQQRYGDKTDKEKAEAVEKKRKELEAGTLEVRTGSAATLTPVEAEFRLMLAQAFEGAKQKKSECEKLARGADREALYRDLVLKPKYAELGIPVEAEVLQKKADELLFQMKLKAERRAEALAKLREENELEISL